MNNVSAMNISCRYCACGGEPAAPEKGFSLSEQNTGSRPFSGRTAGVGIIWD